MEKEFERRVLSYANEGEAPHQPKVQSKKRRGVCRLLSCPALDENGLNLHLLAIESKLKGHA